MIFVALPFAAALKASIALILMTASEGAASLMSLMPSAVAFCTLSIASASPSASRICCCFFASARRMADSFSPSASRIAARFSPSARRMASRRSRSAFICFSIAFWISLGGRMFLSSTRLTLMPHGSVASSRMVRILVLMISRLVRHWSSSRSPMMFLSVVAERFSMATMGCSMP